MFFYILGIFIGNFYQFPFYFIIIFLSLGLAFLAANYKNKKNLLIFFILTGLILGNLRTTKELNFISGLPEKQLKFSGHVLISQFPKQKEDYQQLIVCPLEGKQIKNCRKNFLIYASKYKEVGLGDIFKINCLLEQPENRFGNFNYQFFLANKKTYFIGKKIEFQEIKEKDFSIPLKIQAKIFVFKKLYAVRQFLEEKINLIFSQPQSGYLAGLLLGGEDRLPKQVAENFRKTGTTHTVAVSGFNITIIAEFLILLAIAVGFWRKQAFWIALMGIILFVIMIGAPFSAVRAAVMGGILLWGSCKGRLSKSYYAVLFAAAVMLTFSPLALLYDAGFQLSFLATLGIIFIYGPLSKKFQIKNDFLGLKSILLVTISAQLGVLGIIIYNFEAFSISSLLVNMIILPLIPVIMLLGFITVIIGFFSLFLAQIVGFPAWLFLFLEIEIVNFFAKMDRLLIEFKDISWVWLAGYYLFFLLLVVFLKKK